MNFPHRSILKIGLPLVLGVVLVWFSLQKISVFKLIDYFAQANHYWIFFGVALGIISHVARALRWKYLIQPLGYTLTISNSIMAVFSGYLINYTIPRAGEVSRATIVSNYEKIPFEKVLGTIISERITDVLAMILIIALALVLEYDLIFDFISNHISPKHWLMIGAIGVLLTFIIYKMVAAGKSALALKVKQFFSGMVIGLSSILKVQSKWKFIAYTLFIWGIYILMFYVTSLALPQTSHLSISAILLSFIAASFSIAITNGGIGSYPLAIYAALALYNIPEDVSLAFGWIMWSSQTIMIILLGGLSLMLLPIYNSFIGKK